MISIQKVRTAEDIQVTAQLAAEIWTEHYTPIIGSEQVSYMLDKFQSEPAIAQQMKDGARYFLLSYKRTAVGYFSVAVKNGALFLSKFYVRNSQRGKGIGKAGMLHIEEIAMTEKLPWIRLTVNKYNVHSISAYEKMGFEKKEALVIDIGNGFIMDDFLMEKSLKEIKE